MACIACLQVFVCSCTTVSSGSTAAPAVHCPSLTGILKLCAARACGGVLDHCNQHVADARHVLNCRQA
jgi:hypothetical protein